jgi:uncharacterized repeat protein (TIGR03803 family)
VFHITAAAVEKVLHSFTLEEGTDPYGGLVQDSSGNLYGTCGKGGTLAGGTVFRLDTVGHLTVLHQFAGSPDGASPIASLLLLNGNLFGTTAGGGAYNQGTIFRLTISTGKTTVLYSFSGGADGGSPSSALTGDGLGNVYGTTRDGGSGAAFGNGVVFALNLATRHFSIVHTFSGPDGMAPYGCLVRDSTGNLYGTTTQGGASNLGTVFVIDPTGTLTTLHDFTGGADGATPYAGVARDAKGHLYGAASASGTFGFGTIFEISP